MTKAIRHPELFQLPVAAEGLFKQEEKRVKAARAATDGLSDEAS